MSDSTITGPIGTAPESTVTVVVPTRNAERTLDACLQSLRNQSYPCRTVVVDNGSTDSTVSIAEHGADVVLHAGPERSAQRNLGARAFPADVVGFIDADMILDPTVVEEAVAALHNGAGSVIVPERTIGSGFWVEVRAFGRSFYDGSDAIEAARFFRWEIFERTGGFDEQLTGPEDLDLSDSARRLALVARTVAGIQHDEGTIGYLAACRKKPYYAEGLRRYVAKRGMSVVRQAARRPWMRHPTQLLNRRGAGLVALKAGEATAVTLALGSASIRRVAGRSGRRPAAAPTSRPPMATLATGDRLMPEAPSSIRHGRPHVGFITESFVDESGPLSEGGAERHLWHLARLATSHGVRVTVYQPAADLFDCEHGGIRVVGMPASVRTIWGKAVDRAVADGATHLYFQYINRLPLRPLSLPASATNHGVFWDHPYDATMVPWYPHGRIDRVALPLWRLLQRHVVIANVARCTAVLSTDSSFYHVVQSQAPGLRNRVHVAFNFSDLGSATLPTDTDEDRARTVLAPLYQARADGRLVVLLPRNLSLVRGGGWLPQIVEKVTTATDGRCQFALCGAAVQTQGRASRYDTALADALGVLPPRVRACLSLLGGFPHELMGVAYDLSDMVLIPTYSHESTSLAAIEAMARSCPVIATNVGGLSDVVADGWTGLLVTPTVDAIAAAIVHLAGDAALRECLGRQGVVEARGRFTLERWQERVLPFMEASGWLG